MNVSDQWTWAKGVVWVDLQLIMSSRPGFLGYFRDIRYTLEAVEKPMKNSPFENANLTSA
jgi:hypothetical protein